MKRDFCTCQTLKCGRIVQRDKLVCVNHVSDITKCLYNTLKCDKQSTLKHVKSWFVLITCWCILYLNKQTKNRISKNNNSRSRKPWLGCLHNWDHRVPWCGYLLICSLPVIKSLPLRWPHNRWFLKDWIIVHEHNL